VASWRPLAHACGVDEAEPSSSSDEDSNSVSERRIGLVVPPRVWKSGGGRERGGGGMRSLSDW
jgi:hypothetical protein